ncbi:MAG: hypothetical protein ACREFB_05850 [Stellaceae bacterium]
MGVVMFGRTSDEEAFHVKGTIAQVMQYQRQQMRDEINRIPETKLKSASVDQLAEEMAEKFSINIPVLDESAVRPASREVDIDFSGDPYSRAYHTGRGGVQKGTEIGISVPYQGDAEVFRFHASSHTMDYPRGRIEGSEIVFRRRGANLDAGQVRRDFDGWLAAIKQHLTQMTQELGDFNNTLIGEASNALNARMTKFQRDDQLLAGLGFGTTTRS